MTTIAANLQAVRGRIARATRDAGRSPSDVALIAVSKAWPPECIAAAYDCGQHAFGESYAHEGLAKRASLAQLPLEWHFVGPVQSNKTRALAEHFHWVHSVARVKIARRLNDARPEHVPALNICIQVNVSGEASKSGVRPGEELALARAIVELPRLKLRGLMAVPEPTADAALQRQRFGLLRELKDRLVACGIALDTLSMGMSADFEAAILEGATLVRVGTAIFGARLSRPGGEVSK
ncbi:MAG: YggS family pyridoxal phosphate-dependent enzyme [Burkholderiales bacterium]|jgi:pyridoxal phosphate enzyme (YggS family)|nr:YggS family pyridoxal phosphate-dependent enzyme [Burkholderiales bacterium]